MNKDLQTKYHISQILNVPHRKTYAEAIIQLKRAISINPNSGKAYYFWGSLLNKQGKHDEANKKYMTAATFDSNDSRTVDIYYNTVDPYDFCGSRAPLFLGFLENHSRPFLDSRKSKQVF